MKCDKCTNYYSKICNIIIIKLTSSFLFFQFSFLHWIIQKYILSCQFQQHRIVEEFINRHIFGQTLASSCFDHKFTCQMCSRLRFQRSNNNTFIQRITRNNLLKRNTFSIKQILLLNRPQKYCTYLPMMEYRQTECLSLSVCSQIRLKTKRINGRNKSFYRVQW